MPLDVVSLLQDLVARPSVNPMERPQSGDIYLEHRMTEYIEKLFTSLGLPWQRQVVEPQRDNIIARVDGDRDEVVLLEVHQDTVAVEGMTIDPFGGEVRNGRVYGRGACDVKGSMAAMICAVERLAREKPSGRPTVILACTVNEEFGFTGASALTQYWDQPGSLMPRRPDICVVAEPTELDVVVAHRGIVRWRCRTIGKAVHSSQPHLGDNAIYKMARVVQAFQRYHDEVTPKLMEHPRCGHPTLCVSTIQGGVSVNTVPGDCMIEIDRRLVPGEIPEVAYREIVEYVAAQSQVRDVRHDPPYRALQGLPDDNNGPLAERVAAACKLTHPGCRTVGVPYGTDAAVIARAGVPSVVFGPGSIDQAHTDDEWIDIRQLEAGLEIYYEFLRR